MEKLLIHLQMLQDVVNSVRLDGIAIKHALKRIKDYLRNSMTQERLNHCMLLHMHREKTDNLDLIEIAKEFVSRCERRKNFFGNFEYMI